MIQGFSILDTTIEKAIENDKLKESINFINFLHNKNDKYLSFASCSQLGNWKSQNITFDKIVPSIPKLTRNRSLNYYVSMNGFYNYKRDESSIRHFNALWVDLDFYKLPKFKKYNPLKMYFHLEKNIKLLKDLPPSCIVNSGRGLYLIWKIETAPKQVLKLWKTCMDILFEVFKEYGADPIAKDASRVLRLPGTINQKNKQPTYVIRQKETHYTIKSVGDYLIQTFRKQTPIKPVFNGTPHFHNKRVLHILNDIEKLVQLRNGQMDGYREISCFIFRNFAKTIYADETVEEKLKALNSLFSTPLTDKELFNTTKNNKIYAYKNQTLINLLNISTYEQGFLKILISNELSAERRKVYKNNWQKNKNASSRRTTSGLTKRELQKLENQKDIYRLLLACKKQSEIAKLLNLNKSTISKYIKEIKNNPSLEAQIIEMLDKKYCNKQFLQRKIKQIRISYPVSIKNTIQKVS